MAISKIALAVGIALTLASAGTAEASLIVSASVGGGAAPGAVLDNLDSLIVGGGSPQTTSTGITVSFSGTAGVVQNGDPYIYAPPDVSGLDGAGFGNALGPDATSYLTANTTSTVTLTLPGEETYIGLLWGSVDGYNSLRLYNSGNHLVGTITGADVTASPSGDQGMDGTFYVNIVSTQPFDKVVATSAGYAFEFDNIAYTASTVPEPVSLTLLGVGLAGLGLARRKRR